MSLTTGRVSRSTSATRCSVWATAFTVSSVKLGFMQTPDIPLSLINCNMLGFDADLEHKNYYLAHETIIRRATGSSMGPISFAIFSFLNRIASRAPDFFKIPHDAVIEVGFRVEI